MPDADSRVACVGTRKGLSKADIILGAAAAQEQARGTLEHGLALQQGEGGVFIDDDIREHADPRLRNCARLHRVLFSRSAAGAIASSTHSFVD